MEQFFFSRLFQQPDFFLGQLAPLSRLQIGVERKAADGHTLEVDDLFSPCREHALDLMVFALGHADIGRVAAVAIDLGGPRVKLAVRVADMNARLQRGDILVGQFAVEPRVINLADFMFGRNDAVRQLAVGRDHQQTLGILIQPPGGHRAHRGIHRREQIHHGFLLFVARGGQHAGGLVEHHVADGLVIQRPAVQPDIIRLAADLHARVLRRPAVHRHAPRAHHRFDFASRALAEQRKQLVKPHFVAQILVLQALSFHVLSIIQHDRRFCNLAARLAIFLSTHTICFSFAFFVRVGRKMPAWTRCVQKLSGFRGSSWKHHMNLLFLLHRLWYNADKRKKAA